jgi:UDP-glucose 4-epimerase
MNRRSIVYVGNLCALIDRVIAKRAGGIFLASDDAALSTSDLIAKIGKAIGKTPLLITIPGFDVLLKSLRPSLYRRLYGNLVVDNTATLKKLGFQNPFTTDEGIWLMIHGENDDPVTML